MVTISTVPITSSSPNAVIKNQYVYFKTIIFLNSVALIAFMASGSVSSSKRICSIPSRDMLISDEHYERELREMLLKIGLIDGSESMFSGEGLSENHSARQFLSYDSQDAVQIAGLSSLLPRSKSKGAFSVLAGLVRPRDGYLYHTGPGTNDSPVLLCVSTHFLTAQDKYCQDTKLSGITNNDISEAMNFLLSGYGESRSVQILTHDQNGLHSHIPHIDLNIKDVVGNKDWIIKHFEDTFQKLLNSSEIVEFIGYHYFSQTFMGRRKKYSVALSNVRSQLYEDMESKLRSSKEDALSLIRSSQEFRTLCSLL